MGRAEAGIGGRPPSLTVWVGLGPTAGAPNVGLPPSRITGVGHSTGTKHSATPGVNWLHQFIKGQLVA
jgi:hypothetical protein